MVRSKNLYFESEVNTKLFFSQKSQYTAHPTPPLFVGRNLSSNLLILTKRRPLGTSLDVLNKTDVLSIINRATNKKVIIQKQYNVHYTAYRTPNKVLSALDGVPYDVACIRHMT